MATFVDTNVAVYAYDYGSPTKRRRAIEVLDSPDDRLMISTQVLSEFYWTVTRKLDPPLAPSRATEAAERLSALPVITVDRDLVLAALATSDRHQLAVWDALIVEAAARGGCDRVLTEDLTDGQEIRGVRLENPFE